MDLEERLASATDTITELRETHEMAEGELAFAHNENDALRQHQQETVNHLLETFQAYQKQQAEFAQLTAMFANELQMRLTYILPSDAGLIASRACNGHAAADSMVVPGLQEFGLPTMYDNIAQFLPVLRMVEAAFARFVVDFRPHIVSAVRDYLRNNPLAPFDGEASWHAVRWKGAGYVGIERRIARIILKGMFEICLPACPRDGQGLPTETHSCGLNTWQPEFLTTPHFAA